MLDPKRWCRSKRNPENFAAHLADDYHLCFFVGWPHISLSDQPSPRSCHCCSSGASGSASVSAAGATASVVVRVVFLLVLFVLVLSAGGSSFSSSVSSSGQRLGGGGTGGKVVEVVELEVAKVVELELASARAMGRFVAEEPLRRNEGPLLRNGRR